MKTKRAWLATWLSLLSIAVFITACENPGQNSQMAAQPVAPVVTVVPSNKAPERVIISEEVIPQNNCGGTDNLEYTVERTHTVLHTLEIGGGVSVNASGGISVPGIAEVQAGAEVAAHYGLTYGQQQTLSRSVTIKAKEGSNMQHTIQQIEYWDKGELVIVMGDAQLPPIPYKFRKDFGVEHLESRNIGCPTSTPDDGASATVSPPPTPDLTATSGVRATLTHEANAATISATQTLRALQTAEARAAATQTAKALRATDTAETRTAATQTAKAVWGTRTAEARAAATQTAKALRATDTAEARATTTAAAQSSRTAQMATARAAALATETRTPTRTPTSTRTSTATRTLTPTSTPTPTNTPSEGDPVFSLPTQIPPIESSHPYENNLKQSWYISNDTDRNAMQIHFSRVEIEEGVDVIQITDPEGGLLQEIATSHPEGLWSEILPGAGAYVVLMTDGADVRWGFRVDAMAVGDYPTLARSAHPYPNSSDDTVTLLNNTSNPAGTRVKFDRVELEEGVDYIVISDVDGNPYQWITGSHPEGLTSKAVPGPAVQVRLVSDGSVRAWGYNLVAIEAASPDKAESAPTGSKTWAKTDHPHCATCEKLWTITNPDVGAKSSKVHFTAIDLAGWTTLQILDADDTVVQTFGGNTKLTDVWSDYVPGRIVKLRFVNESGYQGWGFRVDLIESK